MMRWCLGPARDGDVRWDFFKSFAYLFPKHGVVVSGVGRRGRTLTSAAAAV